MLGLKFSQTPYHLRLFREEKKERAYSEGHTVHNLLGVALENHPGRNGQKNSHVHLQSHPHSSQNVQIGKVKQNRSDLWATLPFLPVLCHVASFLYPIQRHLTFFFLVHCQVITYPPSTISSTARNSPSIFSSKALLSTFFLCIKSNTFRLAIKKKNCFFLRQNL